MHKGRHTTSVQLSGDVAEQFRKLAAARGQYHRVTIVLRLGVAQPGSALVLGTSGREFESRRPDQ